MCNMREKMVFIFNITIKQNNDTLIVTKVLFKVIFNNVPMIKLNNKQLQSFSKIYFMNQIIK